MSPLGTPSLEDVLDAFAVEPNHNGETLERYLRDYPQYAAELIDLSRELSRVISENEEPLSAEEREKIEKAWIKHKKSGEAAIMDDPFAPLSANDLRDAAKRLDVPRQIITAFRERKVLVASVPRKFLSDLAAALNSRVEVLVSALQTQQGLSLARSYKADDRPVNTSPVTFEQLLIEAGIPKEKRAALLKENH